MAIIFENKIIRVDENSIARWRQERQQIVRTAVNASPYSYP